ncbi:hypothetical protein MMC13_006131 [Lambiella insularis]|nr:hypothetical protein [Lambiella insularis]
MSAGLKLLESAVLEARCSNSGSQVFARRLYVDALAYLLQGIPGDLTEAEAAVLRPAIKPLLQGKTMKNRNEMLSGASNPQPPKPLSMLHRLMASSVVCIFIFFSFILPYVKVFLQNAYKYERTNHISERLFAASLDTMDQVGKKGIGVAGVVLQSGNGRLGAVAAGIVSWWIDGISGGIRDGVGEGIALLGRRNVNAY